MLLEAIADLLDDAWEFQIPLVFEPIPTCSVPCSEIAGVVRYIRRALTEG